MAKEDYYDILGIEPDATQEAIKEAWKSQLKFFHPDRFQDDEKQRKNAEEKTKEVNEAYAVLSDPQKRAVYDAQRGTQATVLKETVLNPPKPVVSRKTISFKDVEPKEIKTTTFKFDNEGGHYESIWISNPDSWVRVIGYESLTDNDELPMKVTLEVEALEWNQYYEETITVSLDGIETYITVKLQTKPKPVKKTVSTGAEIGSPPSWTPPPSSYTVSVAVPVPKRKIWSKRWVKILITIYAVWCAIALVYWLVEKDTDSQRKQQQIQRYQVELMQKIEERYGKSENVIYEGNSKEELLKQNCLVVSKNDELFLVNAQNPETAMKINCGVYQIGLALLMVEQQPDNHFLVHYPYQ